MPAKKTDQSKKVDHLQRQLKALKAEQNARLSIIEAGCNVTLGEVKKLDDVRSVMRYTKEIKRSCAIVKKRIALLKSGLHDDPDLLTEEIEDLTRSLIQQMKGLRSVLSEKVAIN